MGGLKERVKRNSSILNEIERQEVEDLQNQRWLEQKFTSSLTRSGSLGSNRSRKSVQSSSKDSDDSNFIKPTAPAKPPRSGRSSSTGSKDSKDSKRIVVTQRESSENVFEEETESAETENPYTIIATPAGAPEPPPVVELVVDELPKIRLRLLGAQRRRQVATITSDEERVEEFKLKTMWKLPGDELCHRRPPLRTTRPSLALHYQRLRSMRHKCGSKGDRNSILSSITLLRNNTLPCSHMKYHYY